MKAANLKKKKERSIKTISRIRKKKGKKSMAVFPRPVSNFAEHETHFLNGLLFLFPLPVPFSS